MRVRYLYWGIISVIARTFVFIYPRAVFLAIQTENGTAIEGEDFKQNSASQVQFNPGQTDGKWKIKILPVKSSKLKYSARF